jgi:hypothetical protein
MKKKYYQIILAAIVYCCSVFIGEITIGNPDFPFTIYHFDKIQAWQWSVPVHFTGFCWLLFWNNIFRRQVIILPIAVSTLFFLVGETANWFVFQFFKYEESPLGAAGSFWIIIFLYIGMCTITSYIIRKT